MITKNKYKNWTDIRWKKVQFEVYNLQYKIYCCAKKNNISFVRHYQKLSAKMYENNRDKIGFVHSTFDTIIYTQLNKILMV
jgi:N-terminal domain of reverse transcriptase